jgi:SAM-dependent methyltransferase
MRSDKNSETERTFDARAHSYDAESNWVRAPIVIDPLIPRRLPRSANRFLDVCCGTGMVARKAADRKWKVTAVDRNRRMLDEIKDERIEKVRGEATHLPFEDGIFDVSVMRQALHYLEVRPAIREMFRVATREIRLGHITMFSEDDRPVWRSYFDIVSPGRLHIFAPGDIESSVVEEGGVVISRSIVNMLDDFEGPIRHLGEEALETVRRRFLAAPRAFKERYLVVGRSAKEFRLQVRWEFLAARKNIR